MNHKNKIRGQKKPTAAVGVGGIYFFTMLLLMMVALQIPNNMVETKALHPYEKPLKLFQRSSSLLQLRHKRDTFSNEQQQGVESFVREALKYYENVNATDEDQYYDDNYDVLPDAFDGSQPSSLGHHISETAQQVVQSFTNMWQSLMDSVGHCINALRGLFDEGVGQEGLTPEQEEQLRVAMEQKYHSKNEVNNEVFMNDYENNL